MSLSGKSLALALTLLAGASQLGCRACGTCHDYDSPVANCNCCTDGCGSGRSGSALAHGYAANDQAPNAAEHISQQPPSADSPLQTR